MARLPDSLDLSAVQGERPSTDVVAPTDFGLGHAAQELQSAAIANKRADFEEIRAQAAVQGRQDEVAANAGLTGFVAAYAPAKQKLIDGYDGSQPGLTRDLMGAFDQAQQGAIQSVPASAQPRLQAKLAAMRLEETGRAAETEQKGADNYVLRNGQDQLGAAINTVTSNPLAYDNVVGHVIPGIVATLPAGLRKDAATEFAGLAAAARVKGLIFSDQPQQAELELNDGRYDAVLKPGEKESLLASAMAAQRSNGPKTFDQYVAADRLKQAADAEVYSRLTTGKPTGLTLDQVVAGLSPAEAAHYKLQFDAADRTFAAVGPIHDLDAGRLATLAASAPPDPSDPAYADKLGIWQAQKTAAEAEIKSRRDPGAWAFGAGAKPILKGPAAAAAATAADRGAQLQDLWQQTLAGQPHAGAWMSGTSLGLQYRAGIAPSAWQVIPQGEAARLAASVITAQPEQKLAAMQSLAALVQRIPASTNMPDGRLVSPRALLSQQLLAAHMSPQELAAVVDFGADPAKLGRYVAALNDPTLKAPLPGHGDAQLKGAVATALQPYLASVRPLPGEQGLEQARIDRTALVARSLISGQHMSQADAVKTAAGDLASGYRFVDGWRIPVGQVGGLQLTPFGIQDGAGVARMGAAQLIGQLTAKQGAALYAPSTLPGTPDQQRREYAAQIGHAARWVTSPDDSGLQLAIPQADGSWTAVHDRWGRPVAASWQTLQAQALGHGPSPFAAPPPGALHTDAGQPVPAVSKASAFSALSWATTGQESRFRSGLKSPAGALGLMQVTPDTVQTWAPRLGLPVDLHRAQFDDAYNTRIGQAALADHLDHFGTGAGIGLALAAYNAGRGRLEGYTDAKGYHPGWLQTIGDPRTGRISLQQFVARIPFKETRDYVSAILPAALGRLHAGQG